ncbi:UDP-4-amino-4,6-dideoxy-N-acetyl-beta-L-altrosamine transaminase [Limnobacter sp.]|uniref:UDP-4-amino-4, 6-dideoxy-N-acetyl-beta-L-altrosamine transaminase n=1 Tax=Limnobacter sp. TaxID=2003368 RepID=UPI002736CED3|nr:UDP-4-amino-4,6-dideoxy-N-acetyl-beta-L-altrosamine transaminase [Limnobacter sp.]MDP3187543.1 UDP-4-amino-4,6-dideoxy-N-acetyl-beta-L-altrosamine transaminase [Limnobacter sp.]
MHIPYGRQNISEEDIKAVSEVLQSDFLTQGPVVPNFEAAIAKYCNVNYAFATNSATSALHIACLALDVQPNDRVWTSPVSFVASANCALYCGAQVDFVDIDAKTYNMCPIKLEHKLVQAKKNGLLPKVVIPVHLCGQSCDMQAIHKLSKEYGFAVIEDASHAIGGKYLGKPIGNCEYSHITVFSFHPVKIITTGEGGMALTNDADIGAKMARLRSHGITRDIQSMTKEPDGPWYYEQIELGYNYRMTDMQGALGLSQLKKLDEFIEERHQIADVYNELFRDMNIITPYQDEKNYSSFHLYVVRLGVDQKNITHKDMFIRLRDYGIGVNLHYIPIYRQPYYSKMGYRPSDYPETEKYYSEAITLPIYPGLTASQQKEVVKHFEKPYPVGYQTIF